MELKRSELIIIFGIFIIYVVFPIAYANINNSYDTSDVIILLTTMKSSRFEMKDYNFNLLNYANIDSTVYDEYSIYDKQYLTPEHETDEEITRKERDFWIFYGISTIILILLFIVLSILNKMKDNINNQLWA